MTRIAVPTDNGRVAAHFGRCPEYTIVDLTETGVEEQELIDNPGHQPGYLPQYLAEQDVDVVLAGGMGRRAVNLFAEQEIETATGIEGEIDQVIEAYQQGELEAEGDICDHGEEHNHRHGKGCH